MNQRIERIRDSLQENKWDALVCALPANVLMSSGYWPIVGTGVAVAAADGALTLLVPEDEEELARRSWATEVRTFRPSSLDRMQTAAEAIRDPLSRILNGFTTVGFEEGEMFEVASYVEMYRYSGGMRQLLETVSPRAKLIAADDTLARLKSRKTHEEIQAIGRAAKIAAQAFERGRAALKTGISEAEAATAFSEPLSPLGMAEDGVERAGGHVSCMSGTRSGKAYGAYARSTGKRIDANDLVLTHCNSQVEGYWTDITRTFTLGEFSQRKKDMYHAVFAAHDAVLAMLAPGVAASDADAAARAVMEERGFGKQFKHSTGHGVGFGAIDANALPRLHPKSPDRIEPGMVFNVEPGVYFEDFGGIRQCDVVAMTETGIEVLTQFQSGVEELKK